MLPGMMRELSLPLCHLILWELRKPLYTTNVEMHKIVRFVRIASLIMQGHPLHQEEG